MKALFGILMKIIFPMVHFFVNEQANPRLHFSFREFSHHLQKNSNHTLCRLEPEINMQITNQY